MICQKVAASESTWDHANYLIDALFKNLLVYQKAFESWADFSENQTSLTEYGLIGIDVYRIIQGIYQDQFHSNKLN